MLGQIRSRLNAGHISRQKARGFWEEVMAAMADDIDTHTVRHALECLANEPSPPAGVVPATAGDFRKSFELLGLELEEPSAGLERLVLPAGPHPSK
ncbi:MAG TPA: hypothetical protein VF572_04870 [Candidatus Saccharimonadales bacterium]